MTMTELPFRPGEARLAGPFRVRRVDYPPGLVQAFHTHEGASVTLLLAGDIRERTRAGEETGSPLSVVLKPPGVRHADEIGPRGARTVQVAFDAETFEELEAAGVAPDRWRWLHAGRGAGPLLALSRALEHPRPVTGELEDRVIEALDAVRGWPTNGGGGGPAWLLRIREALDDDPFGERSISAYAREIGVHPVSLSRAFRREFGVTVTQYRRRSRLRRAAAMIAAGAPSLSRTAHLTGFADHSHMCRDFQDLVGVSPSGLRHLAAG
jgi:AraC family transcriptional regulator